MQEKAALLKPGAPKVKARPDGYYTMGETRYMLRALVFRVVIGQKRRQQRNGDASSEKLQTVG